jgi:hypothetical protein
LADHPEAKSRLDKVASLVEGFETPYGMELLASVHWLINHDKVSGDSETIINQLQSWNQRKKYLFKTSHIRTAWQRLETEAMPLGSTTLITVFAGSIADINLASLQIINHRVCLQFAADNTLLDTSHIE